MLESLTDAQLIRLRKQVLWMLKRIDRALTKKARHAEAQRAEWDETDGHITT